VGRRVSAFSKSAAISVFAFGRELTIVTLAAAFGFASIPAGRAQESPPPTSPASKPKGATPMPEIVVTAPKTRARPKAAAVQPQPSPQPNSATAAQTALDAKMTGFDRARDNLQTNIGATTYTVTRETIQNLPQGDNTPLDKVILQIPGVSYDSAASNPNFHIRSEYANAQIRVNGVVVPEGVSGLGMFLDTNFVGSMAFLTGALPAEYGLRTAGVLDITSRAFAAPGGEVSLYGGSRQTFTPSFDYGGSVGKSEYFVSARGNWNNLGIESSTPSLNAIHDKTDQGKFFGYVSTLLDESTRLSIISAASYSKFQIPNNPNQAQLGDFPATPTNFTSNSLDENEYDTYAVTMATLQKHGTDGDAQFSVFSRYAEVHFVPDIFGDLVFNDVASNVVRQSTLTGTQFDTSYILNDRHTLRGGFMVTGEQTNVTNVSTVLPVDPLTGVISPTPFNVTDQTSLLGWNIGTYIQDEWKLSNQLTLNAGLRFDQLYQFVDANQLSPRVALIYKPFEGTTVHAGYARDERVSFHAEADPEQIESSLRRLTANSRSLSQQWPDAYLAAFARAGGLTLVTFDRGLRQMAGGNTMLLR
jgi:outer membrane receptor protein involved in Fe transport